MARQKSTQSPPSRDHAGVLASFAEANRKIAKGIPPGTLRNKYLASAESFQRGADAINKAAMALSLLGGTGAPARIHIDQAKRILQTVVGYHEDQPVSEALRVGTER